MKKILIILFIFFAVAWYLFISAPSFNAQEDRFVVPMSSERNETLNQLKEAGFIRNERAMDLALLMRGSFGNIKSGGYKISQSMDVWELSGELVQEPYMKWIIIPEGVRKEEIAEVLAESLGWSDLEKEDWINIYTNDREDYKEGVYFPDTYLFSKEETPDEIAKRLARNFDEEIAPLMPEIIKQNIRWPTLLKVASLIQREAADKNDMPLVSGILWNRLLVDMKLDVDATIQYIRGDIGAGYWAPILPEDKNIDSPFNTYKYKGLPPTPIANPGIDAIKAALFPEKTDCIYYLHSLGQIYCAKTYEQHQANIEKYL